MFTKEESICKYFGLAFFEYSCVFNVHIVGLLGAELQGQGGQASTCEPRTLTWIMTHNSGGLWLT